MLSYKLLPSSRIRVRSYRLPKLLTYCLFLYAISFGVNADYFEVTPDVTDWKESTCNTLNTNPASWGMAVCRAMGGTWHGFHSDPRCSIDDYVALYLAQPAADQVEGFAVQWLGLCPDPTVTFSGWGQPAHNQYQCWSKVTGSELGVVTWETSNFLVQGKRKDDCQTPRNEEFSGLRTRRASCPEGSSPRDLGTGLGRRCYKFCPFGEELVDGNCKAITPEKDPCEDQEGSDNTGDAVGNPCKVATGKKIQSDTDITVSPGFTRHYNSRNLYSLGLGRGWQYGHQRRLIIDGDSLVRVTASGRGEPWQKVNGTWQGDADTKVTIVQTSTGFRLTHPNGNLEGYNTNGLLVVKEDTNGHRTNYTYSSSQRLMEVKDHFGRTLTFTYYDQKVATLTGPNGEVYRYEYDSNDNLITVIYPDATPGNDTDNPRRIYHYENTNFPNHLTGITDANGNRYANFAYDANGKAILTEHSQTTNPVGQERFELDYQ